MIMHIAMGPTGRLRPGRVTASRAGTCIMARSISSAMHAVLALARNDLRLLARRRGDLFFTFGWPLVVAVFFGMLFAGPGEGRAALSIALVDEDGTDGSKAFASRLAADSSLKVKSTTREDGEALVRQGKQTACVVLKAGFGAAAGRPFFGAPPQVEVGADPSRKAETGLLTGLLHQAAAEGLQRTLQDPEAMQRMIRQARTGLVFGPAVGDKEGLAATDRFLVELQRFLEKRPAGRGRGPGGGDDRDAGRSPLGGVGPAARSSSASPRGSCGESWAAPPRSEWGSWPSATAAPSSASSRPRSPAREVLLGKAVACFVAILAVEALLLVVGAVAFGVRPASLGLLVAASLAVAVAFVGLMMMISTLGRTERSASGAGWAILLVMSMLGGGMVPLFVMPPWMATASNVSPVKWAVLALEGALWRGFTAAEMLLPCAILVLVGGVAFAVGVRNFRTVS